MDRAIVDMWSYALRGIERVLNINKVGSRTPRAWKNYPCSDSHRFFLFLFGFYVYVQPYGLCCGSGIWDQRVKRLDLQADIGPGVKHDPWGPWLSQGQRRDCPLTKTDFSPSGVNMPRHTVFFSKLKQAISSGCKDLLVVWRYCPRGCEFESCWRESQSGKCSATTYVWWDVQYRKSHSSWPFGRTAISTLGPASRHF